MNQMFRAVSGGLNKFVDLVYLSVLWFVCSIPVFTIGASTCALYYAVHKAVVHERSYAGKEFFHCFKKNFKQATLLWLPLLLFASAMFFGAYQSYQGVMPQVFLYVYAVIFILLIMLAVYVFPYISRFEDETSMIIKNCLIISLMNIGRTLLCVLLIAGSAIAVWIFFPLIFFLPGPLMWAIGSMMEKIFRKYLPQETLEAEFERNRTWKN